MYKLKIVELPKPLNIKTQINFPEVVLGKMQEKTVKPKTTFQEILPDKNYDGLSKVNVEAVTNEIDENIKSENIKKDVSILGVQGSIEELKGTKLEITKNGTYTPEEPYNAFTEVDVNVESIGEMIPMSYTSTSPSYNAYVCRFFTQITEVDLNNSISGVYLFQSCQSLKKIIRLKNTQNLKYCQGMFIECTNLETIPEINSDNITSTGSMFQSCLKIVNIPLLKTDNVTNMASMFKYCHDLKKVAITSTNNATEMTSMFENCTNLIELPPLNTSKIKNATCLFRYCQSLTDIQTLDFGNVNNIYETFLHCDALVNLGGFENLGQAYSITQASNYYAYKLDLLYSTKLTHDSLMNVGNNLYDIASKGCKTQQVIIGSTNIGKLTPEELLVFTNKGWSVS